MRKINYKISRWFDLNFGWCFINPNKEQWWLNYLKIKYPRDYIRWGN